MVSEFFCRFSLPTQLHSDQSRQFKANIIQEMCKVLGIAKSRTTPYHPQGDGRVERFNRTLLHMLSTSVLDKNDWEHHLRPLCMAYNSTQHAATGYTPFFLMFGRSPCLPIDLLCGTDHSQSQTTSNYVSHLSSCLRKAFEEVQSHSSHSQDCQRQYYDQTVSGTPYQVNDLVWLHNIVVPSNTVKKFHRPWTGPFRILKCISPTSYQLQSVHNKRTTIVHFNRLKPYIGGTRLSTASLGSSVPPPPPIAPEIDSDDVSPNTDTDPDTGDTPHEIGSNLELGPKVGDPVATPVPRYPTCIHHPPLHYFPEPF